MRLHQFNRIVIAMAAATLVASTTALAIGPAVIYSEIAAHSSGTVPGAKDAAGNPVATNWLALEDLAVRPDGGEWVVKGRTTQATTLDSILVKGNGVVGNNFAQDGQPFQGGAAGEQYDFFDTPIPMSWNDAGDMAFSARAKGGVPNTLEKIVKVVGGTHTVILKQGDLLTGLMDLSPAPSGDETMGNSAGSVHILNDGRVGFGNEAIGNIHSSRRPALFYNNAAFKQSGVSLIAGEVWDSFDFSNGFGTTPDGAHWFAFGDTENPNTAIDEIMTVDNSIVLREGSPVAGSSIIMDDVLFARMLTDATWLARGDNLAGDDWAVRNGVLLAKTGDLMTGSENWGNAISALTGDRFGNWLATANTNNPNTLLDQVMVYNGGTILLRESDPIDLDNNGLYDDNVFLNSFQPDDLFLGDNGTVMALVTFKNGAGASIGDGFIKLAVPEPTTLALLAFGAVAMLLRRAR